jgi:hypothetical protein
MAYYFDIRKKESLDTWAAGITYGLVLNRTTAAGLELIIEGKRPGASWSTAGVPLRDRPPTPIYFPFANRGSWYLSSISTASGGT